MSVAYYVNLQANLTSRMQMTVRLFVPERLFFNLKSLKPSGSELNIKPLIVLNSTTKNSSMIVLKLYVIAHQLPKLGLNSGKLILPLVRVV